MVDRALGAMNLPPGLADQIKQTNSLYRVKCVQRLPAAVRSGLKDTMRLAYNQIRDLRRSRQNVPDYRTAAYVSALQKIAKAYLELGIGH